MILIDENSVNFQREVIVYLFQKIFENFIKDLNQRKKIHAELLQLIDSKKIYNVEDLLSQIDLIAKQFSLPKNFIDDFVRKNYFKATQIIKKQKELLNSFLKNDTNSLKLLSKEIFDNDLSTAKFLMNGEAKYILKLSDKTIQDGSSNSNDAQTIPVNIQKKEEKPKKQDIPLEEENSILKEILSLYPDIEKSSKEAFKNIYKFDFVTTTQEVQGGAAKEKTVKTIPVEEELSILKEILDFYGVLLAEKKRRIDQLERLLEQEEENSNISDSLETNSVESIKEENIEKIPMEISEYLELKIKLQNFKVNNQIKEYQEFLNQSPKHIKACVGILNIMNKEIQIQNFQKEKAFEKLSYSLQYSYESIHEFYNRIKTFNTYIHFVKQGAQYLKEKQPNLYPLFVQIQKPLLELMDIVLTNFEMNEIEFKQELEKKIKILLLFIKEENTRTHLGNFLINFILKSRKVLNK